MNTRHFRATHDALVTPLGTQMVKEHNEKVISQLRCMGVHFDESLHTLRYIPIEGSDPPRMRIEIVRRIIPLQAQLSIEHIKNNQ